MVEFTELGKEEVKFYKKLLHSVMMDYSEDTCKWVESECMVFSNFLHGKTTYMFSCLRY